MPKKILKTREQFTSSLKKENIQEIRLMSRDTGVPISRLLDKAVEELIMDYKKRSVKSRMLGYTDSSD